MTSRMTVPASEAALGDLVYNGPGASNHPTYAWEAITQIRTVDGLMVLLTASVDGLHGEFWFEPDETLTVIRHPPAEAEAPPARHGRHHDRGHTP